MKNAFLLYKNHAEIFEKLSDEQAGKLIKAIFEYERTGIMPELEPLLDMAFTPIKQTIDIDAEKYAQKVEKRREAGSKGGKQRVANQANATFAKQTQANQAIINNDIKDNNDIIINNDIERSINTSLLEKEKNKKEKVFISSSNPDLMFDKRINEVFSLYKKLCPNLCSLVFEERNLERRQEVKDLLVLCRYDLNYIQGLFMRANEQITFYDNKINLKSLIKNHEAIYQGLGKKESPHKETAESMKDKFKEWEQRAKEREANSG
jgi:hypothetical protein